MWRLPGGRPTIAAAIAGSPPPSVPFSRDSRAVRIAATAAAAEIAGVARTVYALMVADRTNWSAVTAQRPLGTKRAGTSLPPYHAMDGSLSFLTHNPTSCLLFES